MNNSNTIKILVILQCYLSFDIFFSFYFSFILSNSLHKQMLEVLTQITELAQIVGKSYENADFQNFVRKCYENVMKKL